MSHHSRTIVVTGAAGFIGSHLVDRLLEDPAVDVVALDNFSRGRGANLAHLRDEPRFKLIEADVRDRKALSTAFAGAILVYHLAAQSSVMAGVRHPVQTFETNVVGTFNVLRAAVECAVQRVL